MHHTIWQHQKANRYVSENGMTNVILRQRILREVNPVVMKYKIRHDNWSARYIVLSGQTAFSVIICVGRETEKVNRNGRSMNIATYLLKSPRICVNKLANLM